jgi:hypothetical protein
VRMVDTLFAGFVRETSAAECFSEIEHTTACCCRMPNLDSSSI